MLNVLQWLFNQVARLWRWLWEWLRGRSARAGVFRRIRAAPARRPGYRPPKPQWVRTEIIRLKALMPEAGCRTIAHLFNRRFAVRCRMMVGKTYVADTVRRQQYLILEVRQKLKHRIPRPVPRNLIWGCDLMVKTDQQGQSHLVLAILDHASRACLRLQRLSEKSAWRLLHHLIQALKRYGRPRYLRTDNEAVFASRRFLLALRLLGITPQPITPGCPWQNGRVERFIGTVKGRLASWPLADREALDRTLPEVRRWYNHGRPHQHLQGRTPAEVWAGVDVFAPTSSWAARWSQRLAWVCADTG
ncbi:MAG: integrase core domain-containing protein [Nitrospiraceae bacterium]